jgi:hypothetical protein
VVLVVVVIAFVAVTAVGFLPSSQDKELLKNGPPNWLRKVGNWLPSTVPPIERVEEIVVLVPKYEGSERKSGSVTIKVPTSDEAYLYLVDGPPVNVNVTEPASAKIDPKNWKKLGEEGMRVVISGNGGTITLRQDGGGSGVSRVRFGPPADDQAGQGVLVEEIVVLVPECEESKRESGSVTIKVPRADEEYRRADLYLEAGPPVKVNVTEPGSAKIDPKNWRKLPPDEEGGNGKERMGVVISDKGGTITLKQDNPKGRAGSGVSRVRFE